MTLQEILRTKGSAVFTTTSNALVEDVVQTLVKHNVGSLLVAEPEDKDHGPLRGIITERDILKACAVHRERVMQLRVSEIMTSNMIVGSPHDSVEDTMGLMTKNRVRHLPIVENGQLLGIISIGDVVKAQHDSLTMENHYLKNYIHG